MQPSMAHLGGGVMASAMAKIINAINQRRRRKAGGNGRNSVLASAAHQPAEIQWRKLKSENENINGRRRSWPSISGGWRSAKEI